MNLQSLFLREKSFEGYVDHAVLECLLTTSGVRGDIPSMITSLYDAFGNFRAILETSLLHQTKCKGRISLNDILF